MEWKPVREFLPEPDDGLIICRCEEITKGEIRRAIHEGMYTYNMVKRFLRPGMGLCQGQTCSTHVRRLIARELGIPLSQVGVSTPRAPARTVAMTGYRQDGYELPEDPQAQKQAFAGKDGRYGADK